jgi:hypothetical protein
VLEFFLGIRWAASLPISKLVCDSCAGIEVEHTVEFSNSIKVKEREFSRS